jgi:hypothetical protein
VTRVSGKLNRLLEPGREEARGMETPGFDIEALKRVFEAGDASKVLEFYSNDLEHIEVDDGAPPKSPRKTGIAYIADAIEGAAQAGIKFRMENPVVGDDRAACTITCQFPDGRRLMSNTIYDLEDGKIVRQFDIQVTDPDT